MSEVIHRRDTCRLCNSRNLELVFQLAPSPIGDAYVLPSQLNEAQPSYPIDTFLCRDCGLSQLLDVIAPEILYGGYIYMTTSSMGLAEHFRRYAAEVTAAIKPPKGGLIVDIGSNDGTLLRAFKELGLKVLGVEPAKEIAQTATNNGAPTIAGYFGVELAKKIRRDHGPASIITANNVLANIDELRSPVEGIRSLLAPDGVFVFESYYLSDVIKNMVFDFIYHEHLSSFAVKPIKTYFASMGMELVDVLRVPTKGGSLRYTVQLAGGPRKVSPRVAELIAEEEKMGLYQPAIFKDFSQRIDLLKNETVSLLKKAKLQGKKICAFGASITVTTLICHFGIGEYLEYLVDDNPAKQGRFSPGLHIPVVPASEIYVRKPDVIAALAWRFADMFIAKHQRFLDSGGTYIVPVPKVRVIGKPLE